MKVAIFWGMSSRLSSLELNPSGEVVGARFAVESVIFATGEIRVVEQVIHPKSHGQFGALRFLPSFFSQVANALVVCSSPKFR